MEEIVCSNNNLIKENLVKIYEKLYKIKTTLYEEEENEYENFYNRINFYFSNIVTELKLQFVENLKEFQKKELDFNKKLEVKL